MKKVLIVEPHNYHYEVMPGIAHFFHDLDYSVEILVRNKEKAEDAFCRCGFFEELVFREYAEGELPGILKSDAIRNFDFIFFNSLEYCHDGKDEGVLDYLGFQPETKYGVMGIFHNPGMINDRHVPLLMEKRIFSLSGCRYRDFEVPILSSSFFGTRKIKTSTENGKRILLVGASNNRMLLEREISQHITEYRNAGLHFDYVGSYKTERDVGSRIYHVIKGDNNLLSCRLIKKQGILSFREMYRMIEESDYLMFYPDLRNKKLFTNGKTSGTKQLSIGFIKPCIIQKDIAEAFGLRDDVCVTYEYNLIEAVRKIVEFSEQEYGKLVEQLNKYANAVYTESLDNLKSTVESCEKRGR